MELVGTTNKDYHFSRSYDLKHLSTIASLHKVDLSVVTCSDTKLELSLETKPISISQ